MSTDLNQKGYCILPPLFSKQDIEALKDQVTKAYQQGRKFQLQLDPSFSAGTAHHILGKAPEFMGVLNALEKQALIADFFKGPYILNSFGAALQFPHSESYVHRIHRDLRRFSGFYPLMLNVLIVLDSFTSENGGTWVLPGSHLKAEKPEPADFFDAACQIVAEAGSVVLFNSNLWHCAGENKTLKPRYGITLTLTLPLMKPQFDYLSLYLPELDRLSDWEKQILGYYSRVPQDLNEWYQPSEQRFYRANQA